MALEVGIAEATSSHAAVVIGNAGLQHGLVLYLGEAVPSGLRDWQPGDPMPTPAGTLLCTLDPSCEVPAELSAKALRYGWPRDAELFPAFLSLGPEKEGGDPSTLPARGADADRHGGSSAGDSGPGVATATPSPPGPPSSTHTG